MTARCGYVTRRATDGPCVQIMDGMEDTHWYCERSPQYHEATHPFLGKALAVCGHKETEHMSMGPGARMTVCISCHDSGIDHAGHTFVPALDNALLVDTAPSPQRSDNFEAALHRAIAEHVAAEHEKVLAENDALREALSAVAAALEETNAVLGKCELNNWVGTSRRVTYYATVIQRQMARNDDALAYSCATYDTTTDAAIYASAASAADAAAYDYALAEQVRWIFETLSRASEVKYAAD